MASRDAQKSEVHETTDDANSSPATTSPATGARPPVEAGTGARSATRSDPGAAQPESDLAPPGQIGGGPGASDGTSGGGAGAGVPDAETVLRSGDPLAGKNVDDDRQKLFPEAAPPQGRGADEETKVSKDPDESSFGGPLRVTDDDQSAPRRGST